MKKEHLPVILSSMILFSLRMGVAQTIDAVRPVPEYTAEQILNGETPGRKAPPKPLPYHFDADGFAAERMFHLPKIGVHPRVMFGPEDLPAIRQRLLHTDAGKQMMGYVREQIENGIDKPGTWEHTLYERLEKGDVQGFASLYREPDYDTGDATVPGNAIHIKAGAKPATNWHHREPFSVELELKAFVALLDNDAHVGQSVAKVVTAYSEYFEPRIDKAAKGRYGNNYWRTIRPVVDEHPFLAMAYDWDYGFMNGEQQTQVRRVLSKITKGKTTLGMDLPAHWRNWNYIGLSMYFCLYSLAIEGEDGYDPRIHQRSVEVIRDFLAYAINPSGMAHEAVGYHSGGMNHVTQVMLAMAIRGNNFFTQGNYRAQFDQWFPQAMQPYGREWFSDGDLGNFAPAIEEMMVAKYFYPKDRKLDFVYQNLPDVEADNYKHDYFIEEMLITASDPDRTRDGNLEDYSSGAALHLPLTYADEARGVLITRSEWSKEALYLNFSCHPDTTFASHDHADRGRFVLSGQGRNWAWQDSRPHDTGDTNSILIDGVGQGYFAPPATWLGMEATRDGSFGSCDAKYAYDWKWRKPLTMWAPDDSRFQTPFYHWAGKNAAEMSRANVELDPSPPVKSYYDGYQSGNPLMWDEDSWVLREPNNPVDFAFRSAGLVRGTHPYALIVDDLKKDNLAHLYSWVMQLEPDLSLQSQQITRTGRDIVIAEKGGDRRLLVRYFAEDGGTGDATVDHYSSIVALRGIAPNAQTGYRLVIPEKAISLRMKVMLFAYREGDPLPVSQWSPDHKTVSIVWADQEDVVHFDREQGDRTKTTITRGTQTVAASK